MVSDFASQVKQEKMTILLMSACVKGALKGRLNKRKDVL